MFSGGIHDLLFTGVLLQFTGPRSTACAFVFLLVTLCDLTLLTMITYRISGFIGELKFLVICLKTVLASF